MLGSAPVPRMPDFQQAIHSAGRCLRHWHMCHSFTGTPRWTVPSSPCQKEAVKPRKELFHDRERVSSFGVRSAHVSEVPVREGICTAEQSAAIAIHPELQHRQC